MTVQQITGGFENARFRYAVNATVPIDQASSGKEALGGAERIGFAIRAGRFTDNSPGRLPRRQVNVGAGRPEYSRQRSPHGSRYVHPAGIVADEKAAGMQ
jgi:hypothetical protein